MSSLTTFPLRLRNRHFLAVDMLLLLLTPVVALALRIDGVDDIVRYFPSLLVATLTFLVIKLAVFYRGGLYSRYWRYASVDELADIALLSTVVLFLQTLVFFLIMKPNGWVASDFPRSIPVIDAILSLIAVGGLRYSVRLAERHQPHSADGHSSKRVIIAGAGWAGVSIIKEMQRNPQLGMNPVAFVDDDPHKQGMRIRNVAVLGKCSDITRVARETGAMQVVIAMPTAQGKIIRDVVHACEEAGLQAKTVPGMYELLGDAVSVKQLREIKIEDLLRRDPIKIDTASIARLVRGKRVLVTGGGGSIGSELCRQLLRFEPESLTILGHGENSIFEIFSELTRAQQKTEKPADPPGSKRSNGNGGAFHTRINSTIADIRSASRLRAVFDEYRPEVVFHAAAHKHVHLMELNPTEAITNNVLGTRNVLEASLAVGVEQFVMISTDKAVNPVGIMGASKRVAELLVHQAAERSGRPYVAVRFGNVLGSRGSAVLTFQKQIAAGGPVTVTHPDMKRFFMTIPEAVQLVLQAATLGRGGEVFMLDMGDPVKIVDLAKDLIELSGLQLGHDIEITYTGLRPGEKLYEEMFLLGEDYKRTQHEKIFLSDNASSFVPTHLDEVIARLEKAAECNDGAAVLSYLNGLVSEYQPVEENKREERDNHLPQRVMYKANSPVSSAQGRK